MVMSNHFDDIRNDFPHTTEGHIYLNHAAVGPLSTPVRQAIESYLSQRNQGPIESFQSWMGITSECRERVQKLISAPSADQIAFTSNTSEGLSLIAESLEWSEGDEIILNDLEFPANVQPFRALERKGVSLVYITTEEGVVRPEQIKNVITPQTRMVSISAVQYLSGFSADLKAIGDICRQHGLWFVVDGIQALGAVKIDVEACGIDALATGGHKWLMSDMGVGFLYLGKNFLDAMTPSRTGWLSVENPLDLHNYNQPWLSTARRFDTGTPNMTGIISLNASIAQMLAIGLDEIEERVNKLAAGVLERARSLKDVDILTPSSPVDHAGIVSFRYAAAGDPDTLVSTLKKEKITISTRDGYLRVAPHFYNTASELDQLFNRLT